MKYICQVCEYVYDEEAEGVPFADLPDDWTCPLCGVPKSEFAPRGGMRFRLRFRRGEGSGIRKEEGFVPSSFFASCRGSRKFSGEVLTNRPDLCKIKCAPCAPNVSAGCADKRKARTDIPFRMRCVRDEDCGNSKSGLQFSDRKRWSDRLPGERKAFPDLPSEVFRISYAPVAQLDRASAS